MAAHSPTMQPSRITVQVFEGTCQDTQLVRGGAYIVAKVGGERTRTVTSATMSWNESLVIKVPVKEQKDGYLTLKLKGAGGGKARAKYRTPVAAIHKWANVGDRPERMILLANERGEGIIHLRCSIIVSDWVSEATAELKSPRMSPLVVRRALAHGIKRINSLDRGSSLRPASMASYDSTTSTPDSLDFKDNTSRSALVTMCCPSSPSPSNDIPPPFPATTSSSSNSASFTTSTGGFYRVIRRVRTTSVSTNPRLEQSTQSPQTTGKNPINPTQGPSQDIPPSEIRVMPVAFQEKKSVVSHKPPEISSLAPTPSAPQFILMVSDRRNLETVMSESSGTESKRTSQTSPILTTPTQSDPTVLVTAAVSTQSICVPPTPQDRVDSCENVVDMLLSTVARQEERTQSPLAPGSENQTTGDKPLTTTPTDEYRVSNTENESRNTEKQVPTNENPIVSTQSEAERMREENARMQNKIGEYQPIGFAPHCHVTNIDPAHLKRQLSTKSKRRLSIMGEKNVSVNTITTISTQPETVCGMEGAEEGSVRQAGYDLHSSVANAAVPKFRTSLFGCMEEVKSCVLSFFLPCVVTALTVARLEDRECTLCDAACGNAYMARQSLRAAYGLAHAEGTDCLECVFCHCCMVSQTARELALLLDTRGSPRG